MLKKVDKLDTDEEFYEMMTGLPFEKDLSQEEINKISPSALVNENTVPSLIGYGLKIIVFHYHKNIIY